MNKAEYVAKLEATKVTDQNTIAEGREARKAETALRRWWKTQAIKYVLKTTGEDITANPYHNLKFDFNLKPTGSIIIEKYSAPDNGIGYSIPSAFIKEYRVPKGKILTPTTRREVELTKEIKELTEHIDTINSLIYAIQKDPYNKSVNTRRITGLRRQIGNRRKKINILEAELEELKKGK